MLGGHRRCCIWAPRILCVWCAHVQHTKHYFVAQCNTCMQSLGSISLAPSFFFCCCTISSAVSYASCEPHLLFKHMHSVHRRRRKLPATHTNLSHKSGADGRSQWQEIVRLKVVQYLIKKFQFYFVSLICLENWFWIFIYWYFCFKWLF